jgi:hypothetical protein
VRSMRVVGVLFSVTVLLATGAFAQSSKFAATYDNDVILVDVGINGEDGSCQEIEGIDVCTAIAGPVAEAELASLHVANWKELLIGMSGQINLVTLTQAKGKNAQGTSTAIAEGTVRAGVLVLPEGARQGNPTAATCARAFSAYDRGDVNFFSAPGPVIFAARHQELSVTVDLDVINDPVLCAADGDVPAGCVADLLDIEGSVTVALGLDTTASHHFNFVEADLDSGWYEILACYDLSALAEVSGADIDADTSAYAKAALGPRIVTVQEVRATKDGVIDETGGSD